MVAVCRWSLGVVEELMTSMQQYRPWRFLVLLLALILLLVIQPIVRGFSNRGFVVDVLYSLLLIAAVLSLFERKWPRTAALILGIPALSAKWLAYLFATSGDDFITLVDHFVEILFLGCVAAMVLRAVLTQGSVSLDSIFGAICAYLLIGMAWGTFYSVIEVAQPGSFQATGEMADALKLAESRESVLTYYSFVTMTTVGYGDITPLSPPARTFSWLEAMMGQFYIAVLVAFLVGIRVSQGTVARSDRSNP
jgi:voltage-gated potassium channel